MVEPTRQMHLAVVLSNSGAHPSGWRYPGAESPLHDIQFYCNLVRKCEQGKLDAFFIADAQGFRHIAGRDAYIGTDNGCKLEPLTMLSALAMVTSRIGLIATCSTTYNEPYAVARRFASLDHISQGRAGWNVVTSATDSEARNFGLARNMEHDRRYERADEFIDVVNGLWDSWENGAYLGDQANGRYFDPTKAHALDHVGQHFQVAGPLNVERTPQGRPVIFQAGSSGPGKQLAARTAEVVFTAQPNLKAAQSFYKDIKGLAAEFGRNPDHVKIMPAVQLMVRSTEVEAQRAEEELRDLMTPELALSMLQMLLGGVDLSAHPFDGPLPEVPISNESQSVQKHIIAMARTENLTIRQLASRVAVSRAVLPITGTPAKTADVLELWFKERGADGFALSPHYLPGGVTDFVDHVVPVLQARGLFRKDYEGVTLRDHLGVPEPENQFVTHPERHREPRMWAPVSN